MHPRGEGIQGLPHLEKLKFDSVDTILVSHAHHDHTGSLPLLMRDQPGARVFMSEATYYLSEPLLHNSVQVMLKQKAEKGIVEYPLFTHRELDELVKDVAGVRAGAGVVAEWLSGSGEGAADV